MSAELEVVLLRRRLIDAYELLDTYARAALAEVYTPEGVDVWWRAHETWETTDRAKAAFRVGEMSAT